MKRIIYSIFSVAFSLVSLTASAQYTADSPSGTLSPYSQFGLGLLQEPLNGFNSGMNGLGVAMRGHNEVNTANPASYSAIDSLTFVFDAGITGQMTNFKQDSKKINRYSAGLDYVSAIFRASKGLGISFGLQPYSQIGYDYKDSNTKYHSRQTGIQNYYIGIGWRPVKYVSVGANVGYLHGEMDRTVTNYSDDANTNTYTKRYTSDINSYKVDFGLQVHVPLNKKDELTLGATYGLGHDLKSDLDMKYMTTNTVTNQVDTVPYTAKNAFSLPHTFAGGISYSHGGKWRVGADYSLQKWASLSYPEFKKVSDKGNAFVMSDNYYLDRQKITVGGEYCANEMGRNFMSRIRYRLGASYTTPYYKLKNGDGPKEISVSAGFAIPIVNGYNNRSILNISAQWVNMEAPGFVKENSFRIKIGFTFNERWFMKWKVE